MVEKRLEPPTVSLRNYSGTTLSIVKQIKVQISRDGFSSVEAMVRVQKDAPTKLLIGTDILPQLGFVFLQTEIESADIDLLVPRPAVEDVSRLATAPLDTPQEQEPIRVVQLIQATRLPARHQKLLRARVTGCSDLPLTLLSQTPESWQGRGCQWLKP